MVSKHGNGKTKIFDDSAMYMLKQDFPRTAQMWLLLYDQMTFPYFQWVSNKLKLTKECRFSGVTTKVENTPLRAKE